jgi:hypothetical protein
MADEIHIKVKKGDMPPKIQRRYERFMRKYKGRHDMYIRVYGEAFIAYYSWSLENTISWLLGKDSKPGFRFLDPDEVYIEEVKEKYLNKKNNKHG